MKEQQNMKTRQPEDYKIAFVIFTVLGGLMLAMATVLNYLNTSQTIAASLFTTGAIGASFLASLNYTKYTSVRKGSASA
jgi:small-conductance mechanosensitive channel